MSTTPNEDNEAVRRPNVVVVSLRHIVVTSSSWGPSATLGCRWPQEMSSAVSPFKWPGTQPNVGRRVPGHLKGDTAGERRFSPPLGNRVVQEFSNWRAHTHFIDTRKFVTGYLMVLNGGPVSWKASRQGGVTLRSSETEFVAASQAGQEVLYLRALLEGFAYLQYGPTEIWEDNESCILMSENPTNRERSCHVDVRVHFLRDMVRNGSVKLIKCASTQNVADALTKSLPRPVFHKHREFLKGTAQSFSAFSLLSPTSQLRRPTSRKGAAFTSPKPLQSVSVDNVYIHHYRGEPIQFV